MTRDPGEGTSSVDHHINEQRTLILVRQLFRISLTLGVYPGY